MISYNNTTRAFLRLSPPTRLMHCIYVRNTLKHAHKLAHGTRIQYIILFHLKNVKRTNHRRRSHLSCIIYSKPSSKRWSSQNGFSCHSSHAIYQRKRHWKTIWILYCVSMFLRTTTPCASRVQREYRKVFRYSRFFCSCCYREMVSIMNIIIEIH
jgi:hypothetical protein